MEEITPTFPQPPVEPTVPNVAPPPSEPNIPPQPASPSKFRPIFLALALVLLIVASGGTGYFAYQNYFAQKPVAFPTSLSPTPEITANWKAYTAKDFSFKYPSSWELLEEIPKEYRASDYDIMKEGWVQQHLTSKMFTSSTCQGPILRNTQVKTTLLAFEVVDLSSDGAFCWSSGNFTDSRIRTVNAPAGPLEVSMIRWKPSDYTYPVTRDNSGKPYSPEWQGDIFEITSITGQKLEAVLGLVYKDGTDQSAEPTFDQILSTFKFTD
jgi:hypothetical protein